MRNLIDFKTRAVAEHRINLHKLIDYRKQIKLKLIFCFPLGLRIPITSRLKEINLYS